MNRRGFLGGLLTALAAPAIIRTPGLLMAVRAVPNATEQWTYEVTTSLPSGLTHTSRFNSLVRIGSRPRSTIPMGHPHTEATLIGRAWEDKNDCCYAPALNNIHSSDIMRLAK